MINLDRVLVYISSFFLSGFFEIQKGLIIISILPSTDVNIGCHMTFWRHNSTSVHRPGISSWTNAVNFKLTPGADWWHNHFGFVTHVYFIDQKVIFADINKNWKMMSSNNSLVLNRRLPMLIKVLKISQPADCYYNHSIKFWEKFYPTQAFKIYTRFV